MIAALGQAVLVQREWQDVWLRVGSKHPAPLVLFVIDRLAARRLWLALKPKARQRNAGDQVVYLA